MNPFCVTGGDVAGEAQRTPSHRSGNRLMSKTNAGEHDPYSRIRYRDAMPKTVLHGTARKLRERLNAGNGTGGFYCLFPRSSTQPVTRF